MVKNKEDKIIINAHNVITPEAHRQRQVTAESKEETPIKEDIEAVEKGVVVLNAHLKTMIRTVLARTRHRMIILLLQIAEVEDVGEVEVDINIIGKILLIKKCQKECINMAS